MFTTNDMKPGRQCRAAAAKASSMLGLIKRHFKKLDIRNFRQLYKAYIRLHLVAYTVSRFGTHQSIISQRHSLSGEYAAQDN